MFVKLGVQSLRVPCQTRLTRGCISRGYAKKPDEKPAQNEKKPDTPVQNEKKPETHVDNTPTSISKGYPKKPNDGGSKDSAYNPRDLWKGKFFDLTSRQSQALNEFVDSQNAATAPFLTKYDGVVKDKVAELYNAGVRATADQRDPIRVCVTGAAGAIGYALLFRIASGGLFGPHVPITLHLLELPAFVSKVKGVEMELRDSAFGVLRDVLITDNADRAFEGIDYALLVGAQPRTAGMERGDLLLKNAEIFATQGKALNKFAKAQDTRVLVVGNPANTNALIAQRNAPRIPPENFTAMTRLDHNRGLAQLAIKTGASVNDIEHFIIWGNHSATQFPDVDHATIRGVPARQVVNDDNWIETVFTPCVQKRGAEVIAARGASSAASAASALVDAAISFHYGTAGKWTSAAVFSKGEYGIQKGLFYSYPIVYDHQKKGQIINGLTISDSARKKMEVTEKELISERDAVAKLLPS